MYGRFLLMSSGKVYIIGAGPGDPGLITMKAVQCIESSDVIVYDRLVGGKILSYARRDAELVYVGKKPDSHPVPQWRINEMLVEKALEGKTVARVKGGDPFVFGRGGEEAESLAQKGIEFEIVPGITSAVAVPAYAGIPVTHRDHCSSLHIITGHERPDKNESSVDFEALARLEGTLVFLMGIKNLDEICKNLIKHGKDPMTPAAVIEKGTTTAQRNVSANLESLYQRAAEMGIESPAVTIIGDVVSLGDKLKWYKKGKLAGKKVLVTRAREQASELVKKIESIGGEALEFPTIRIETPKDRTHFDGVLTRLENYDWLVFTSVNGVRLFFEGMREKEKDIRILAGVKICAVGEATRRTLECMGLTVDFMPEKYTTECLLEGMLKRIKKGQRILLARADIGNPLLAKGLSDFGAEAEDLVVYKTVPDTRGREGILDMLVSGEIDFITFTSSSTVRNFAAAVGCENLSEASKCKVVCIGPVTAKTAEELGIRVSAAADVYTIDGLVKKMEEIMEG
jgi:uroporphyrinogen III methyltransferase/synthase